MPAKAMAVSDNRPSWPTGLAAVPVGGGGPGRATGGRPTLQTSSNQHDLNRLARTSVTNVVNLSPKTTIFNEKAVGLTTFVTTRSRTPQNDCNTSSPPRVQGLAAVPVGGGGPGRASRRRTEPPISDKRRRCGGRRRDLPRCRWAAAGPGRASRRRTEPKARGADGSRAGRRPPAHTAAGPSGTRPPVGTQNRPAPRVRAAQSVSEAHRRITTMSGSPRPLSWRTLEIPSLAAISFAVPSMRGSS